MTLPTDAKKRKAIPIYSGFIKYFPDAIAAVAELSRLGNAQHNPGKDLFWDRSKSGDELDAQARHLTDHAKGVLVDTDGVLHLTKNAWRAMAALQKALEASALADSMQAGATTGDTPITRADYPSRWLMRDLGGHEWETSNEYTYYNAAMLFNCSTPILRLLAGGISKQDETTCDDIPRDHAPSCPCYVCAKARRDATGQWEPNDDPTAC